MYRISLVSSALTIPTNATSIHDDFQAPYMYTYAYAVEVVRSRRACFYKSVHGGAVDDLICVRTSEKPKLHFVSLEGWTQDGRVNPTFSPFPCCCCCWRCALADAISLQTLQGILLLNIVISILLDGFQVCACYLPLGVLADSCAAVVLSDLRSGQLS